MDVGDFSDVSLDRSEDLEDEIEYFDTQATMCFRICVLKHLKVRCD